MPVFDIETPGGKVLTIEAPDEARAMAGAKEWHAAQEKPSASPAPGALDTAKDIGASAVSGATRLPGAILGLSGSMSELGEAGGRKLVKKVMGNEAGDEAYSRTARTTPLSSMSPFFEAKIRAQTPELPVTPSGSGLPSAGDINAPIQRGADIAGVPGPDYEPRTPQGKFAKVGTEFSLGAMFPGSLAQRALNVAVPTATSEGAGQVADKYAPEYGPHARIAGALLGIPATMGAGKAAEMAGNRLATGRAAGSVSDALGTPVSAGAVRRVAQDVEAGGVTPSRAAGRSGELGDQAMLMDMDRQLAGRAEAIAQQRGPGQNTVLNAVEGRTGEFGSGTAARVEQTLNREMGPSHNAVELGNRVDETVNRIARPLYDKVMSAHPVVEVPADIASRPAIAAAMKDAERLALNYGEKLKGAPETKTILKGPGYHIAEDVPVTAQPSLKHWDYVKKVLDQRINGYYKSGGATEITSAEKADLGGLLDARKALVNHLDNVTGGAYKEARQVMATKYELKEGFEFGRSAFSSKLLPEEFAAAVADMSVPERAMAKAGFRRELDRIIESTRNEGATVRRKLDETQVLKKTEALFGPQARQEIERVIGAENVFQNATQKISQNSATARRAEAMKDTAEPSVGDLGNRSLFGTTLAAGKGAMNYALRQGMSGTRGEIANMLTSQGGKMDSVIDAIANLNRRKAALAPRSGSTRNAAVLDALIAGQDQSQR